MNKRSKQPDALRSSIHLLEGLITLLWPPASPGAAEASSWRSRDGISRPAVPSAARPPAALVLNRIDLGELGELPSKVAADRAPGCWS